jgi:cytoskeletal protein CcmA (bactofilin family)
MASTATIAADTRIEGTLAGSAPLTVEGVVLGEIRLEEVLTVAEGGYVRGTVEVDTIVVAGAVSGEVSARERIVLTSTARVTADLRAPLVEMHDGARLRGELEVVADGQEIESSTSSRAASTRQSRAASTVERSASSSSSRSTARAAGGASSSGRSGGGASSTVAVLEREEEEPPPPDEDSPEEESPREEEPVDEAPGEGGAGGEDHQPEREGEDESAPETSDEGEGAEEPFDPDSWDLDVLLEMDVEQLRRRLQHYDLPSTGLKDELVERLLDFVEERRGE